MRFQVPQFIAVEDKIIGSLTIKQFIYIAGGGAAAFMSFKFLPIFLSIFFIPFFALFGLALALGKINSIPFVTILESAFKYLVGSKLYIWHKNPPKAIEPRKKVSTEELYVPKLSESRLKDLTWSLDIKESENPVTGERGGKSVRNV